MILTLICIFKWIEIGTHDNFTLNENGASDGIFQNVNEKIEKLLVYQRLTSINVVFMFLRIMQYFEFSNKLSMFYDVISQAFMDIIFFTLMQFIILFGYAFMGLMLFGTTDKDFSSVGQSIITLFLITIGSKSVVEIKTEAMVMRGLFGATYMIINMLLLNMLVAIYISHYFQYYSEMGSNPSQIFSLVIKIITGVDKDDDIERPKSGKKKDKKPGCIKRIRLRFRNYIREQEMLKIDYYKQPNMDHLKHIGDMPNYYYASKEVKRYVNMLPVSRLERMLRNEIKITHLDM